MKIFLGVILATFLGCSPVFGHDLGPAPEVKGKEICSWPVPQYQIKESIGSGITKTDFNKVLDQVQKSFDPVMAQKGLKLRIIRSWSDGTVNAQAWWSGSTCNIEMFGGLARFPGLTAAAFRQVALHEIGHCIGGAPLYTGETMSVEGQADYFATLQGCRIMKVGCKNSSLNLARALARMSDEPLPWRPGDALPEVTKTYEEHPEAQCRLNTYDAGLEMNPRPRCWFKP